MNNETIAMVEILKKRLPKGLEIVKIKNQTNRSQVEITFSYNGKEKKEWLHKVCEIGFENRICDRTVSNVMAAFALDNNDLETAKYWIDKALNPIG